MSARSSRLTRPAVRFPDSDGGRRRERRWREVSLAQASASDSTFRALVVLLSSPRQDLDVLSDLLRDEQRRWTERQQRAVFRVIARTGHAIQRDRPDTVVAVIRSLLATGSESNRLLRAPAFLDLLEPMLVK